VTNFSTMRTIDDIRTLCNKLPGPDKASAQKAIEREPTLTKPRGSLGRLEELVVWLSSWQNRHPPRLEKISARVFAANHGVTKRGVSAYPSDVTAQMVENFRSGGAAINQICKTMGVDLVVEALDLDHPSEDFTIAPAMSKDDVVAAFRLGMESLDDDCDLLCLGEMGIGNTTAAAAICCALYGGDAALWTGPGTGLKDISHKASVVAEGVSFHQSSIADPLCVLRCLGGREFAALAGAIIGARIKKVPVLLDGYVVCAAASVLEKVSPGALDHCQVGHTSKEPGHKILLQKIKKESLLDLSMGLGEASGAVLACGLLKAALACHTGMATFEDAGVSGKK
jgi:nicotinate-nucleotide--dimethylbenzimidazole phosphoribosyltransferase